MSNEIHNGMDVIDSRDIIARLEELESWRNDALIAPDTAFDGTSWVAEDGSQYAETSDWNEDTEREWQILKALVEEASGSPDWKYGEILIRDIYFEAYAQELAEDIGAINRDATWPNNYIDWEAAADALKMDYFSVDFDGVDYWIRS